MKKRTVNNRTRNRNTISNNLLFMLIILSISTNAIAQDSSLKIHYTFSNTSADGQVTDNSGNGCDAMLRNKAILKKLGRFDVLDLGTFNGFLDLGTKTGSVIQSLTNFSVALNLYVDSTTNLSTGGNFIWTFANSSDMARTANGNMFFSAKDTRYAISKTIWTKETGVNKSSAIIKGKWVHIAYTQTDSTGTIYINGQRIKTGKVNNKPSDLGATTNNYIGKSCYNGNSYLRKTLLNDFRLYNRALSATEVTALASHTSSLDSAIIINQLEKIANLLDIKELDAVYSNLKLPTDVGSEVVITWKSANKRIISNQGVVKRPALGKKNSEVVLTAILTKKGVVVTKDFSANVIPHLSKRLSIERDSANLFLGNLNLLMFDLTLPKKGIEGSVIKWSSSNPAILSNEGIIVTRPTKETSKSKVTLSATIKKGNVSTFKTFVVNVQDNTEIEKALIEAKQNRAELINVIKHYQVEDKNPTKEAAAIFLIENMDAHYTYKGKAWDAFCFKLDSVFQKENNGWKQKSIFDYVFKTYGDTLENNLNKVPDLEVITSKYLINNIDQAIEAWKSPYSQHLTFDEFCEYLLPYKVADAPIENWRELYLDEFIPPLLRNKKVELGKNTNTEVCTALKDAISLELYYYPFSLPDFGPRLLEKLRVGTCRDYGQMAVYAGRAIGLPVSMDYTPQWAKRSMGHEWNSLYNYDKKSLDFAYGSSTKLGEHLNTKTNVNWIAPKVYRLTYAKQKESLALIHGTEEIPWLFESPCFKDVSKEYFLGANVAVDIKVPAPNNNRFAYLAVFDNQDWIPVHWAEIKNKKALFSTMNRGAVYLPVYYTNNGIYPAAYPVMMRDSGAQIILKPDLKHKQTLVAERKYTDASLMYFNKPMEGGKFQFSNDPQFHDSVDAYITPKYAKVCYNIIDLTLDKPYKYFRYLAPSNSHGDMAEIEVYEAGNPKKLTGEFIGNTHSPSGKDLSKAFDDDVLTYFYTTESWGAWVGLKFDIPKQINKLVYLPRNDDNCIRDGELYELFYWDNRWVSLGKQTGSKASYRLTYVDIPTNALFLLSNLTKGREERIFTYENGKQVWW